MFDYASKKPLHKYSAQFGSHRGSILVFEEGIVLHKGTRNVVVRNNYVESLSKKSSEPFSKVRAEMSYYDMFGNKEVMEFVLSEIDFRALKQDLGK